MEHNVELVNRFVSDYKLPIPITFKEELFKYYLNLLQPEYRALDKWNYLCKIVNEQFNGKPNEFLDYYYNLREEIIQSVLHNEAYIKFNNMNMTDFSIKDKPNVSSGNIFNENNVSKYFLSIDLKKANFQALRKYDSDIVFGCETYEDFIGKFTDLDYVKESKYSRQVIFGKLNPSRHITLEKYYINEIRKHLENEKLVKNMTLVSMSNDELVYDISEYKKKYGDINVSVIVDKIKQSINDILSLNVSVESFKLVGWRLKFKKNGKNYKTFFEKVNLINDERTLKCIPEPIFPLTYKLYKGNETTENDLYVLYDGILTKIQEEFEICVISE